MGGFEWTSEGWRLGAENISSSYRLGVVDVHRIHADIVVGVILDLTRFFLR